MTSEVEEYDEPSGCPSCGAIAGCCDVYPHCPGNPKWDGKEVESKNPTTLNDEQHP